MDWWDLVRERLTPAARGGGVTAYGLGAVLLVAAGAAAWEPLWHRLRIIVTLVHELGHASVGMACGRRFTGFVVRGDASGHAVTVGPSRGFGRVATTWAGYPAPALAGAALITAVVRGHAAPVLGAALVGSILVATQVRSLLTALVVMLTGAATGGLWWWRDDAVQTYVALAAGVLLLAGGWRGLANVTRRGRPTDDPAVLAALTHLPAPVWLLSWLVVNLAASGVAVLALRAAL